MVYNKRLLETLQGLVLSFCGIGFIVLEHFRPVLNMGITSYLLLGIGVYMMVKA